MTDDTLTAKTPAIRVMSIDSDEQLELVSGFLKRGKLLFSTEAEQNSFDEFHTETGILPAGLVSFKDGEIFSVIATIGQHLVISENGYAHVSSETFEAPIVEGDGQLPSRLLAKFWDH